MPSIAVARRPGPDSWLRAFAACALLALGILPASAALELARQGTTRYVVAHAANATPAELHAARELATTLGQICGCAFPVVALADDADLPRRALVVGAGAPSRRQFPGVDWDTLGAEEIVLQTRGTRLLLAGGSPRGTLYAVSRFLQDQCGVRWWTPWATHLPSRPNLKIETLAVRAKPAFEVRDPFWHVAFDPRWAVRNFSNSQSARIPAELGGAVEYKGFVHTFYPLVPPEEHFDKHPEWYSLLEGKRTHQRAQLCLTQPELLEFTIGRVRAWLREAPQARLVSISQNDWYGACQCDPCKALDDAEGSHAGTMLTFVNAIAARLESEFPHVLFDTLAYQYTRKPPRTVRPRTNVVVRLCSIECDFREPLSHPSNAAFADDLRGWSQITDRLAIWDYTTDFSHYVQPHPNWFVLGENLRFFHQHHVRGVFEQGAYQSAGSEMAEMRAWVLAQLLWNPFQDDRALIREFVQGYFGPQAAPHILRYFEDLHAASAGAKLTCFAKTDQPCFRFAPLSAAEAHWQAAESASAAHPEFHRRVQGAHLPVRYVWLSRWDALRAECEAAGGRWPLPESRAEVADAFARLAAGSDDAPWTRITHLNEGGRTVAQFLEKLTNAAR
ncbi:MAG: DUF4838 domain-containing protein [Verrucomicrobiales bacterium]|nr:DUF4838 domain-containing protein [Verrucomicrobiales bacterium]